MPIKLDGSNGITLPTWTTAARPSSPANSQFGYNSNTNSIEYYDGTGWIATGSVNVAATYAWTNVHTFTANVTIDRLIVDQVTETINVSATAATGTIAFDTFAQSAMYLTTNASANWTPNFRANSTVSLNDAMSNGQSITVAMMVTQGATAYFSNSVQINATTSGVTTRWLGAAIPTAGDVNAIDIYTYTIVKTATNTFTVFAGLSQYK
jgi:hypothetical protein